MEKDGQRTIRNRWMDGQKDQQIDGQKDRQMAAALFKLKVVWVLQYFGHLCSYNVAHKLPVVAVPGSVR